MRVLVTGSQGYIGSLLGPELMARGYEVVGMDTGFYRERLLYCGTSSTPLTIARDIRRMEADDFRGVDAVVHLGELSNDPAGQLDTDVTFEINHHGSVRLASMARDAGVKRFIYTSSCSVYGIATQEIVDEQSPLNPQTAYGRCKMLVEQDLRKISGPDFCVTLLRNATAFGASPSMRFDIVLNNLAGMAWTRHAIEMTSDGTPWRPLVHALDICQAVIEVLEAPVDAVENETFNIGDTSQNYRVREIAEVVAQVFRGCELKLGPPNPDNRSYRVSFEKIRKHLPEFRCRWDAFRGARQLYELFQQIGLDAEMYEFRTFTRLSQLQHLLRTRQINNHFFWTHGYKPQT